jgi:quercetin dioxygenase-like cupin family protein
VSLSPSDNPCVQVNRGELARLLRVYRERRNDTVGEVQARLQAVLEQKRGNGPCASRLAGLGVTALEDTHPGRDARIELLLGDLALLAEVYVLPRLILDSLLSEQTEATCVAVRAKNLIAPARLDGAMYQGVRTCYRAPAVKLANTEETAFVHLRVDPGGHSDSHAHPGDEFLFVLEGEIEIRLEASGLRTVLGKDDYLHFYSEQKHSAWNHGAKPAEVFIVRYYQLESSGTRSEFLRELGAESNKPSRNLLDRVRAEMTAAVAPFPMAEDCSAPREVTDSFGLGRLLRLICSAAFQKNGRDLSLPSLVARAGQRGLDYNKTRFHRIHHGLSVPPAGELEALARHVYEVEPMLLYDFLFPTVRQAVAVRRAEDWVTIPEALVAGTGVKYEVPSRRLAETDISITSLQLAPGGRTPLNRHPGHELILPLEGSMVVGFGDTETMIRSGEHLYAHYFSRQEHSVANPGNGPARALVLRFYE